MNIKEAKQQIKNAITAYFTKDEFGGYVIPIERQRPVFLMGSPGIGKTAIMEQITQELGIGLVIYSMTHHTRQSAIGLPFITRKTYGGQEYDVSEYTMSEIIASVYDMIEEAGQLEGILFLDEINCVSETLAPAMLQFLQFKIFGRHRVPDGWIVVTAGNPPEYNKSVRDFDIVTWDRLKRINVEPDYEVWKEYGSSKGVHPAVLTYLDIKKDNFYLVETTVDGKTFVTARGWVDLAEMLRLYETHGIDVDEKLVSQYLQNPKIAKDFAIYYDLFNKYRSDYQIDSILSGKASEEIKNRAGRAKFDERIALLGLLLDIIFTEMRASSVTEDANRRMLEQLKKMKAELGKSSTEPAEIVNNAIDAQTKLLERGVKASSLTLENQHSVQIVIDMLGAMLQAVKQHACDENFDAFKTLRAEFENNIAGTKKQSAQTGKRLSNMFKFCETVFQNGQELLILATELTINYHSARFIGRYGCAEYFRHNKDLLLYERQLDIINKLDELDLSQLE
jgi:hypothetical protein